eukprot:4994278-Alexandrium_andersonii.AAC.1
MRRGRGPRSVPFAPIHEALSAEVAAKGLTQADADAAATSDEWGPAFRRRLQAMGPQSAGHDGQPTFPVALYMDS